MGIVLVVKSLRPASDMIAVVGCWCLRWMSEVVCSEGVMMREEAGLKGFFYGASLASIRHRHKQQVPQAERALWQRCVARQGGRASSAQNAKTVRWATTLLARHFSGTIPRITFRYTESSRRDWVGGRSGFARYL